MKFLNKLTPPFLKRLDRFLLLNYPALWNLKLHYLIYVQLWAIGFTLLLSYGYPVNSSDFLDAENIGAIVVVMAILMTLLWLFLTHQFDIRTRLSKMSFGWESARMASYAWAYSIIVLLTHGSFHIILNRVAHQFRPLAREEVVDLESYLTQFKRSSYYLARGQLVNTWFVPYGSPLSEYPSQLSQAQILDYYEALAQLNYKYGDGKEYAAQELLDQTLSGSENNVVLEELLSKANRADWAFRRLERNVDDDVVLIHCFTFLSIFGLLGCLIYYYKFFDIRGLVLGLVAWGTGIALAFALGFVFFEIMDISPEDSGDLVFGTVAFVMMLAALSKNARSARSLFLYQAVPVYLAISMAIFYMSRIYESTRNWIQVKDQSVLSPNFYIFTFITLAFYALVVVPIYHYGLYKLYQMPKK